MHAARLDKSPRLQAVLHALQAAQPGELSTREIILRTGMCAVNAIVAELRANGAEITCRQEVQPDGRRIWLYRLEKAPETKNA